MYFAIETFFSKVIYTILILWIYLFNQEHNSYKGHLPELNSRPIWQ